MRRSTSALSSALARSLVPAPFPRLCDLPISRSGASGCCFSAAAAPHGKSALVTGGAGGLGEAICRRLASDGYKVVVCDVADGGKALADELGGHFVRCDVSDPAAVKAAVAETVSVYGGLDAMVNNAGVVGSQLPIGDYDLEEWHRVMNINMNGTFYGMRYGLAQMALQETGGSMVNMSSVAGFRGLPNLAPYTASKSAVRGLTQMAAVEYSNKKIRVNAIAPTACETPMVAAFIAGAKDPEMAQHKVTDMNALPGFVQPSDVAAAAAFLLSEDARFITGHTLPVDAGALSRMANRREL